jgi:hypothetical protein
MPVNTKCIYTTGRYLSTTVTVPSSELGPPHPLSRSECVSPPLNQRRGEHTRLRVRGWGSLNLDYWRKSALEKKRSQHSAVGDTYCIQGWKKPGFFKKNPAQWVFLGFFGFFWVFGVFLGFFGLFARTRGFLGFFSVSRILLDASRL